MAEWLDGNDGEVGGRISGTRPPRATGRERRTTRLITKLSTSVAHTIAAVETTAPTRPVANATATPHAIHRTPLLPSAEYPIATRSNRLRVAVVARSCSVPGRSTRS